MLRRNKEAFTLIELMVVSVILALVSLVIFSTFNNGMKIWKRVQELALAEDINIFFDRCTQDVSNAFYFTGIGFKGYSDRFRMPVVFHSQRMGKRTIGMIQYRYDHDSAVLMRSLADYSQLFSGEEPSVRSQLNNISKCAIMYYSYDTESKTYVWTEEYSSSQEKPFLPRAVRLVAEVKAGGNVRWINKTFEFSGSGEKKP